MKYDLAIIGAGPGGYTAADCAAKAGLSVVIFECADIGGTCLSRGCIPTKSIMYSAETYREMKQSDFLGVSAENVSYDFKKIHARKDAVVKSFRIGIEKLLMSDNVTVVYGFATVKSYDNNGVVIRADSELFEADYLIIATGAVPSFPKIYGIDLEGVYTSNDLLDGDGKELKSLIIVGGGVIGCEFASIYLDLGCKVIILESKEHILPPMDAEIAQRLTMYFKKQGADINTSSRAIAIEKHSNRLNVTYENQRGDLCITEAEAVLISTGRRADTKKLFEYETDLEFFKGGIVADKNGKTKADRIYVVGDAKAKNIQLAHVAEAQAENAVAAILGGEASIDVSVVPTCIYTSPEIASVGFTEEDAEKAGFNVKVKKSLTSTNGRCLIENSESGYIKTVTDAVTGKLLGAQLVCPRATDLVAEFALAISKGMKTSDIANVIHPHPTFSEMIISACE